MDALAPVPLVTELGSAAPVGELALTNLKSARFERLEFDLHRSLDLPAAPIRVSSSVPIAKETLDAIAAAARSVHDAAKRSYGNTDWSGHIDDNCHDLNQRAAVKISDALRLEKGVAGMLCGDDLHLKISGVEFPENFSRAIRWMNHYLGYVPADGAHIAVDLTARRYLRDAVEVEADVIAAPSLAELSYKLSCYYGGRAWNREDFNFASYL